MRISWSTFPMPLVIQNCVVQKKAWIMVFTLPWVSDSLCLFWDSKPPVVVKRFISMLCHWSYKKQSVYLPLHQSNYLYASFWVYNVRGQWGELASKGVHCVYMEEEGLLKPDPALGDYKNNWPEINGVTFMQKWLKRNENLVWSLYWVSLFIFLRAESVNKVS